MPITDETRGGFLPTSFPIVTDNPKELGVRLYQDLSFICKNINSKDSGYYPLTESVSGQLFFMDPTLDSTTAQTPTWRGGYRKVVDFGALPNAATKSVAHGILIDSSVTYTRTYATATDPVNLKGTSLFVNMDATNVSITTTSNMSAYTRCLVIIEFIRS